MLTASSEPQSKYSMSAWTLPSSLASLSMSYHNERFFGAKEVISGWLWSSQVIKWSVGQLSCDHEVAPVKPRRTILTSDFIFALLHKA